MAKKAKRRAAGRPPRSVPKRSASPGEEVVEAAAPASNGELKCRHFTRGVDLGKLEEKLRSSGPSSYCLECSKRQGKDGKKKPATRKKSENNEDEEACSSMWFCLACSHVGCAKTMEDSVSVPLGQGHALEHFRRCRHPFVLQCGDGTIIRCMDCQENIVTSVVDGSGNLGARGEILQQAVKLIQESWMRHSKGGDAAEGKMADESVQEVGGAASVERDGDVQGLVNLGNTCFFNSVMQNLLAVRCLRDYFLSPVDGLVEGPLTSALRKFFLEINGGVCREASSKRRSAVYNPKGLFGALCGKSSRFSGYHQQDSHELLRCLLDGLHVEEKHKQGGEDDKRKKSDEDNTFVDHLFGGQFASTVTCCECGHSSSVLEPFLDVSLPIPQPHSSKGASSFKVAHKVVAAAPSSKRELKAKKALDRRKKGPQGKAASKQENKDKSDALDRKDTTTEEKTDASASVEDDFSWLDYVADDFVDVSHEQQSADLDDNLLEVTSAEQDSSVLSRAEDKVAKVDAVQGVLDNADKSVDVEVPNDSISTIASDTTRTDDATVAGDEESKTSKEIPEVEPSASPPGVILLPYWGTDDKNAQEGWEVLPSMGSSELDGVSNLFEEEEQEQEAATSRVTVLGCAERPGTLVAEEEIEDIVERSTSPKTLKACLLAFTKLEVLSGENAWGCDNCTKLKSDSVDPKLSSDNGTIADAAEDGPTSDAETESTSPSGDPGDKGEEEEEDGVGEGEAEENDVDRKHPSGGKQKQRRRGSSRKVVIKSKATKRLVIRKAPPVLTVHLKRFAQDLRGRLSKLTGHVAFEELLNLSPYLSSSKEKCLYRLVGVVEHSGTMKGGHYVAFVRGSGDGEQSLWYYVSDSEVRRTTLDHVLRREAYLLFYEKV